MAEASSKLIEGVFAINKPASLSSAQVLRDLQNEFKYSRLFRPLLEETRARENQSGGRSKRRKISQDNVFKMGHGGTLDPMATGVLIVGIGRGTKHLIDFLDGTKTYDTVVLFGKSTDTYDIAGKIVADALTKDITKEEILSQLGKFRGSIDQIPPIYSALKINGMKAYEYARSGKELPRQLESRPMRVTECDLVEWYEAGQHGFRWPAAEATPEDKAIAQKLIDVTQGHDRGTSVAQVPRSEIPPQPADSYVKSQPTADKETLNQMDPGQKAALHTHDLPPLSEIPADAPAARIRLTVSSGFYVRSFAHDLGIACGSLGIMAELARIRQGQYSSLESPPSDLIPCLLYDDLGKGEDTWAPKLAPILEEWMKQNPIEKPKVDDRDRRSNGRSSRGRGQAQTGWRTRHASKRSWNGRQQDSVDRRNSSSPD